MGYSGCTAVNSLAKNEKDNERFNNEELSRCQKKVTDILCSGQFSKKTMRGVETVTLHSSDRGLIRLYHLTCSLNDTGAKESAANLLEVSIETAD